MGHGSKSSKNHSVSVLEKEVAMARTRTLVFVGLLVGIYFVPLPAPGQDKKPDQKDPQSIYEPPSKPGSGQKFLERFVGDWDVDKAFYGQMGDASRTKGTCKQTMQQGGRFLYSDFTFGEGNNKTTGLGIIGYEPDMGLFSSVWIDSRQTKMSLRQSRERFNGKEIVLFGGSLKESAKPSRGSRTVTQLEDDGNKIVHRQFNAGQDGTERLFMELVL